MENWKRKGFHIWGQPWIHREYNACVITPMMDGGQDIKVSSIIDPINHCWDTLTLSTTSYHHKMSKLLSEHLSCLW